MRESEPVALTRDLEVVEIPAGTKATLPAGAHVLVTQTLGGNYTVMTVDGYLFRVDGKDADSLGKDVRAADPRLAGAPAGDDVPVDESLVQDQLRTVYDPEIPVNIVDLGLVYDMRIGDAPGGQRVDVKMTLTAPGCGMGGAIASDARQKLLSLPGVSDAEVEVVWDPPWSPQMISPEGKERLGMS
jgi:probable FeS assembly SUF system protein SufT